MSGEIERAMLTPLELLRQARHYVYSAQHSPNATHGYHEAAKSFLAKVDACLASMSSENKTSPSVPVMECTGCGSRQSVEEIRAAHPGALSCCPERNMQPVPTPDPRDVRIKELESILQRFIAKDGPFDIYAYHSDEMLREACCLEATLLLKARTLLKNPVPSHPKPVLPINLETQITGMREHMAAVQARIDAAKEPPTADEVARKMAVSSQTMPTQGGKT